MTSYPEEPYAELPDDGIERVVLLDEDGRAIGTAPKHSVHHADTPLHLAFSCYVFDADGRLLVTQRALGKVTWPGVWTNTVCGHPAPGEGVVDAVRRRVRQEVGVGLQDLRAVLPTYRYRAVMADGTVENEMCPVFVAVTADLPDADPAEVEATAWVAWADFCAGVVDGSRDVSPWCLDQVRQLAVLGGDPRRWPAAPTSALPPAGQPARHSSAPVKRQTPSEAQTNPQARHSSAPVKRQTPSEAQTNPQARHSSAPFQRRTPPVGQTNPQDLDM